MQAPIANFGFSRNNLNVDFKNLSLNIDNASTYEWDFGDGSIVNTDKNPSKVYASEGFYSVSLSVTTAEGVNSISMAIGVGSITNILNTSILSLTYYYLPSTMLVDNNQLVTSIQTWQMYLQPLVENPLVDVIDTHNELQWPALVNKLIAMLTAKERIEQEASAFLAQTAKEGSGSESSNSNETITSTRSIKSIETGPAKTEWYEDKDSTSNSETIKNIGDSFYRATQPGGIVDILTKAACNLSKRLMIYLPECGQLPKNVYNFQVGATPQVGSLLNSSYTTEEWELLINW